MRGFAGGRRIKRLGLIGGDAGPGEADKKGKARKQREKAPRGRKGLEGVLRMGDFKSH
jgi:hypothetical protein